MTRRSGSELPYETSIACVMKRIFIICDGTLKHNRVILSAPNFVSPLSITRPLIANSHLFKLFSSAKILIASALIGRFIFPARHDGPAPSPLSQHHAHFRLKPTTINSTAVPLKAHLIARPQFRKNTFIISTMKSVEWSFQSQE
jgi:hypothetical protein